MDRHFDLGRAYLEAGAFMQADSEFDRYIKRRVRSLPKSIKTVRLVFRSRHRRDRHTGHRAR